MQLTDGYCLDLSEQSVQDLSAEVAETVYQLVCRTDFEFPGYALIDFGTACDSPTLRLRMIQLKDGLSRIHRNRGGDDIIAVWLGRFNQQITTKFHLDGGPQASLLMLGYEPTAVVSQVRLADYSKCAAGHELSPLDYLNQHNPMLPAGERFLQPYIAEITRANSQHFHLLLINNSCQSQTDIPPGWQGVLHQAIMLMPNPGERRVVNSMLLTVGNSTLDALTPSARHDYLTTDQLNQRM